MIISESLEKWKKDLLIKTEKNARELFKLRKEYECSLKLDQQFP